MLMFILKYECLQGRITLVYIFIYIDLKQPKIETVVYLCLFKDHTRSDVTRNNSIDTKGSSVLKPTDENNNIMDVKSIYYVELEYTTSHLL